MSGIGELITRLAPGGVAYEPMGKVFEMKAGRSIRTAAISPVRDHTHPFPCYGGNGIRGYVAEYSHDGEYLLIGRQGALSGNVKLASGKFYATEHAVVTEPHSPPTIDVGWSYHLLIAMDLNQYVSQGAQPGLAVGTLAKIAMPVPPLELQREIVRMLDSFTALEADLKAELEARRRQYGHYRDILFDFDHTAVRWAKLPEISTNLDSRRRPVTKSSRIAGEIPYYGASGVVDHVRDYIFDGDYLLVSEDGANLLARSTPIAFSISGKTWVNNHAHILEFPTYSQRRFVEIYLNSIDLAPFVSGGAQPKLNQANLNKIPIPSPTLDEQDRIVGILDKFDALVNDPQIGIPAELNARRKQYEYYRNCLLSFQELAA